MSAFHKELDRHWPGLTHGIRAWLLDVYPELEDNGQEGGRPREKLMHCRTKTNWTDEEVFGGRCLILNVTVISFVYHSSPYCFHRSHRGNVSYWDGASPLSSRGLLTPCGALFNESSVHRDFFETWQLKQLNSTPRILINPSMIFNNVFMLILLKHYSKSLALAPHISKWCYFFPQSCVYQQERTKAQVFSFI